MVVALLRGLKYLEPSIRGRACLLWQWQSGCVGANGLDRRPGCRRRGRLDGARCLAGLRRGVARAFLLACRERGGLVQGGLWFAAAGRGLRVVGRDGVLVRRGGGGGLCGGVGMWLISWHVAFLKVVRREILEEGKEKEKTDVGTAPVEDFQQTSNTGEVCRAQGGPPVRRQTPLYQYRSAGKRSYKALSPDDRHRDR